MPQKWSDMTPEQQARKRAKALEWYYANRERIAGERASEESRAKQREWSRDHRARNREAANERSATYRRERRAVDPAYAERERAATRASHHKHRDKRQAAKHAKWSDPDYRAASNEKRRAHHAANREHANSRRTMRAQATRAALPWAKFFHSAQQRAKKKNVPFWLTRLWCETQWTGRCAITGIEFDLTKTTRGPGPFSPSLDRIVPALGYVPENCRFVLWAVNALKGEATDAEMLLVAEAIVKSLRISNP